MSGQDPLESAVREVLTDRGVLDRVKAEIRTEIVKVVKEAHEDDDERDKIKTLDHPDDFVIGELIKEYLAFKGHNNTKDVFALEASLPKLDLDRRELEKDLNVRCTDAAGRVPLLYSIVAQIRKKK